MLLSGNILHNFVKWLWRWFPKSTISVEILGKKCWTRFHHPESSKRRDERASVGKEIPRVYEATFRGSKTWFPKRVIPTITRRENQVGSIRRSPAVEKVQPNRVSLVNRRLICCASRYVFKPCSTQLRCSKHAGTLSGEILGGTRSNRFYRNWSVK